MKFLFSNFTSDVRYAGFELGLFDDPYKYCDEERAPKEIFTQENRDYARKVAAESMVLLKNENQLLPLKKEGQKIALIGSLAADKNSPLGSWRISADDGTAVSVLEGMQQYTGNSLEYKKGADFFIGNPTFTQEVEINTLDKSEFGAAVAAAPRRCHRPR